jgi:hypothetical protein
VSVQNTYIISPAGDAITCRCCGRTSYNPNDVAELFCSHCKIHHVDYDSMQHILTLVRERAERAEAAAAALQRALDQQTARADILAAQVAGWAAQCAAQVDAIRQALDGCPFCQAGTCTAPAHGWLRRVVETDAGAVLLSELAALRRHCGRALAVLTAGPADASIAAWDAERARLIADLQAVEQGGAGQALLAEVATLRTVLRASIHRIEDVLEDADEDDGIVGVSALVRLGEHYDTELRPVREAVLSGTDAQPALLAEVAAARKMRQEVMSGDPERALKAIAAYDEVVKAS